MSTVGQPPGGVPEPGLTVSDGLQRERLTRAALAAVRGRTWEASLDRLAAGYRLALEQRAASRARSVA